MRTLPAVVVYSVPRHHSAAYSTIAGHIERLMCRIIALPQSAKTQSAALTGDYKRGKGAVCLATLATPWSTIEDSNRHTLPRCFPIRDRPSSDHLRYSQIAFSGEVVCLCVSLIDSED